MRKRWVLLFAAAVVCVATIVYATNVERTISVNTITLSTQSVEKTVQCDGVIEAGEKLSVFPKTGCFISEVVAQKGMYVQEGDVLAYVDKSATKASGKLSPNDALTLSTMSEEIRAPKSGIILKIDLNDGMWIEKTDPCAVIAPSDSIRVRVAIREKYLPKLRSGLSAVISGDALSDDRYYGELKEILSTAQSLEGGGTIVEGVVEFVEPYDDPSLRIGVNVKAKIVVETVSNGVVIPYEAVSDQNESQSYVYVLADGEPIKHMIDKNNQLSSGLLVQDERLIGKTIIADASTVQTKSKLKYTAEEER